MEYYMSLFRNFMLFILVFTPQLVQSMEQTREFSKIRAAWGKSFEQQSLNPSKKNSQQSFERKKYDSFYDSKTEVKYFADVSIQWAAGKGDLKTVAAWIAHDPSSKNSTDKRGETALHWASSKGHIQVVHLLMQSKGISLDAQNNKGQTSLSWAAFKGHIAIAKILLDAGANVELVDKDGKTPFQWAAGNGKLEILKILCPITKDINQTDFKKQTALHWAAWNGHLDIVQFLVAQGADLNAQDIEGITPLMRVSEKNHANVAQFLLRSGGANINTQTSLKKTALHIAAWSGSLETIKELLLHDPEVNLQDEHKKRSALQWVIRMHEGAPEKEGKKILHKCVCDITRLLMDNGADPTLKDCLGFSAIDYLTSYTRFDKPEYKKELLELLEV